MQGMQETRRPITLYAEASVLVPHAAPDREVAEGLLQAFAAFLTNQGGLRASFAKVQSGPQEVEYTLTCGGEPVTFNAPELVKP